MLARIAGHKKLQLKGKVVEIMTDNIVSMAYINSQGGPTLTSIAKAIWDEALLQDIHIQARHVPRIANVEADGLSRIHSKHEWTLHPKLFKQIEQN